MLLAIRVDKQSSLNRWQFAASRMNRSVQTPAAVIGVSAFIKLIS